MNGGNVLPNFLILGAAKAGTSAVFHYFNQHPDIYMYPAKETNFWALQHEPLDFRGPGDDRAVNTFSITSWERYTALWAGVQRERAVGEASPLYLYHPAASTAIHQHLPNAKLIVILRHPVRRAYSAFCHMVRDRRERLPTFAQALEAEPERIRQRWEHIWHYATMGLYAAQVARYTALFPPEQLRVYVYDDLLRQPLPTLQDMFRFLEVDPTFVPDLTVRHNPSDEGVPLPPLLPAVRQQLRTRFADDLADLEHVLGRDLAAWRVGEEH
jgi:hypothetical protein